tara:strand:- start:651 stop:1508 length:858 start_codon:yes stop_codon:yes gene_type:complete
MKKNNKHSKFKNTGVLFELLVRQITHDTLSGDDNSPALGIIKEFFKKRTSVKTEMKLYQSLQSQKFNTEEKANRFIDAICEEYRKINKSSLRKEKYNLIKKIKSHYNLEEFFKVKISNYKLNASISKTLDNDGIPAADKVRSRYTIVENIINKKVSKETIKEEIMEEYKKQDTSLRILSYKILLEKFNKKYGKLSKGQKDLLREYINNISNNTKLNEYVSKEINGLSKKINVISKKLTDKIVKIKLSEVTHQLNKIKEEKTLKDVHLISLMRSYELLRELKNVSK